MAWTILLLSGFLESGWALCLKASHGLSRLWPSLGFVVLMVVSLLGLAYALKTLPVGPAYAAWTGIGAAITAVVGMIWLGEGISVLKIVSLVLIVAGIIGLNIATKGEQEVAAASAADLAQAVATTADADAASTEDR